ncbi:MAG TPA: DUF6090 family protein [Chitinophagaceae bacterium]|nr:DUF6090 family protein [Chitinophagaceae bacterium]
MAEEDIIKHTKKIYKAWNSKEHSSWQKLKEFFIEIFIIVFAVTISIWLHNWSEHKKEQKDVKVFLLGLKEDLQNDIKEMQADSVIYVKTLKAFSYITKIKYGEILNTDSLKVFQNYIFNTTGLIPNNGRFEGFKSSGKIGLIENNVLQNEILDLYQENIPNLITSTNAYTERKKELFKYIDQKRKRNPDNTDNLNIILSGDTGQNISAGLVFTGEILGLYGKCIGNSKNIIERINLMYPGNNK